MERYSIVKILGDRMKVTNKPGIFGRCITYNFVDEWLPAVSGIGQPPYPRELWIQEETDYNLARQLLIQEAKKIRAKLLEGLGGVDSIDLNTEQDIGRSDFWKEQVAQERKRNIIILPK